MTTAPRKAPTVKQSLGLQLLRLQSIAKSGSKLVVENHENGIRDHLARLAVERFFEDAKFLIAEMLKGGVAAINIPIRSAGRWGALIDGAAAKQALEFFSWKHEPTEVPPNNRYRDVWDHFVAWAKSEELDVSLHFEHDGGGEESWYSVIVKPCGDRFKTELNLAGGTVLVSKDKIQEFGSAQGYLDHLERLARG